MGALSQQFVWVKLNDRKRKMVVTHLRPVLVQVGSFHCSHFCFSDNGIQYYRREFSYESLRSVSVKWYGEKSMRENKRKKGLPPFVVV